MTAITPCLWFDGTAEEAARFHVSVFDDARMVTPENPTPEGAPPPVMVVWEIAGQRLLGLNGGSRYTLSPAFSLSVEVDGQDEIDRLWAALTADGGRESMCGWLEDRFGVSWQILPRRLAELLGDPDPVKARRVADAFMQMKKIDIAALEAARSGRPAVEEGAA